MSNRKVILAARRLAVNQDFPLLIDAKIEDEMAVLLSCHPDDHNPVRRTLTRIHLLNELVEYTDLLAREDSELGDT